MNTILVGGVFDDKGGRASGYVVKLANALYRHGMKCTIVNGGTLPELADIYYNLSQYQVIFWMVDVDNELEKYLPQIKASYPHSFLISSKYNQGRYTVKDLMQRALSAKSNLLIEFNKSKGKVLATVYDPLCNAYCVDETNVNHVAEVLAERLKFITRLKRVHSVKIEGKVEIPDNETFFSLVREHSHTFSHLIQGINPERFLGNCSFRCETGFPSFKKDNLIFVSKRNCNKDTIDKSGFVAIDLDQCTDEHICYYSSDEQDIKPSVDAPVQVELYKQLSGAFDINYMLHSHTYIKNAPFTAHKLPCGSMEEVKEIMNIVLNTTAYLTKPYYINLRGHGSLVLAHSMDQLKNIPYIAREQPEIL